MTFIDSNNGYDAIVSSRETLIAQGTLLSNVITITNRRLLVKGVILLQPGESIVLDGSCTLQGSGYVFGGSNIGYVSGGFAGPMITANPNSLGTLISGIGLSNPSTNANAVCIRMGNTHRVENCGIAAMTAVEIAGNCYVLNNYINPVLFSGPGSFAINAFKFVSIASSACENSRILGNIVDLSNVIVNNYCSFIIDCSKISRVDISNNILGGSYGIRGDSQTIEDCNISNNTLRYSGTSSPGSFVRCQDLTGSLFSGNTLINENGLQSYFVDTISKSLNEALGSGGRMIGNSIKASSSFFTHNFSTQAFTNTSTNCRVYGNLFANINGASMAYIDSI
jgi:hypothetical protein